MAFREPWTAFKAGDLVYGIDSSKTDWSRSTYLDSIFKNGLTIEHFHVIRTEKQSSRRLRAELESFVAALRDHPKFLTSVDGEDTNENVRRKDKGGLLWAAKNGKTVHFVLDGLDMRAVVGKSFAGANPDRPASVHGPKNRSITGAELRWLYRNRHLALVQACVQFWFYKTQVCPPWETYYSIDWSSGDARMVEQDGVALWSTYTPKSQPAEAL